MLGGADPFDLEIVHELAGRHSDALALFDGEAIRFDLRRRIDVAEFRVEKWPSLAKLLHMTELVNEVQVDGSELAVLEVIRADEQVSVDVARPHVSKTGAEEFYLQGTQDPVRLSLEETTNGGDFLEPSEEFRERVEFRRRLPLDLDSKRRFDWHSVRPRARVATKGLSDFGPRRIEF